jgi:hypothetical protein
MDVLPVAGRDRARQALIAIVVPAGDECQWNSNPDVEIRDLKSEIRNPNKSE